MNGSRKILIVGGVWLVVLGMLYGLHYAAFVEHQTLEHMGGSLAGAFSQAALSNWSDSETQLAAYADSKYDYVRRVDAHSHWIGLAMLMIVLGVLFDRVNFAEATRRWLAISLLAGSILFPLAVLLQTKSYGGLFPAVLAITGSGLVTMAMTCVAIGFLRKAS